MELPPFNRGFLVRYRCLYQRNRRLLRKRVTTRLMLLPMFRTKSRPSTASSNQSKARNDFVLRRRRSTGSKAGANTASGPIAAPASIGPHAGTSSSSGLGVAPGLGTNDGPIVSRGISNTVRIHSLTFILFSFSWRS